MDNNQPEEFIITEAARDVARQFGRMGGKIGGKSRSAAKVRAARENAKKAGRKARPLSTYACTCGRDPHLVRCPLGAAMKRAEKRNTPQKTEEHQ